MIPQNHNQILRLPDGRALGYAQYADPQGPPVFHFHAAGSSRLEYPDGKDDPHTPAVRLLVADRPSHGLSSFQKHRTLLDWTQDVKQLADHLGIDQFEKSLQGNLHEPCDSSNQRCQQWIKRFWSRQEQQR